MSTKSLDITTIRPRRALPWVARIAGAATVVAIGLLTAGFFLYTATNPNANASASLSSAGGSPWAGNFRNCALSRH